MFTKQDSAKTFRKLWLCEPEIGHQVTLSNMLIAISAIEGDTLFWQEISWDKNDETKSPNMIADKTRRKAFINEHVLSIYHNQKVQP
jgi:hypothetical protein